MALPYSTYQILFNAANATANAVMSDDLALNAGAVEVQLILAGFTGTVEFDGSIDGATWVALPYQTLASGALTLNSAALSWTTSTTSPTYVLPLPMPHMRLTMTRSAGTISAYARGFSNPFDLSASLYPAGSSALSPWLTASFAKPDVTVAGSSGAWTTGNSPITIFSVTGAVLARFYGLVTADITSTGGTGTLALGSAALATAIFSATTVNGTAFKSGYVWGNTVATALSQIAPMPNASAWYVVNGDVKLTIGTNSMTAGGMTLAAQYIPIGSGTLVAATP